MNIVKAERATVTFFDGLSIDGYQMPDGEFRVSLTGASVLLGYQKNWLGRILLKSGTPVKGLQERGFSGFIISAVTPLIKGGGGQVKTISIRDFNKLIHYAANQGKVQAYALQDALTDMALTDFFRDAFGLRVLSIDEKRDRFYSAFAARLTHADWLNWDREDTIAIADHLALLGE